MSNNYLTWWRDLSENNRDYYRTLHCKTYLSDDEIETLYNKVLKEPQFTAGQQVWVNGKPAVYLFHQKENDITYFVYGRVGGISYKQIDMLKDDRTISATKPLPDIKPGTPVVCWGITAGLNVDYKYHCIFIKWNDNGTALCATDLDQQLTSSWKNCEVYEF